MIRGRVVGQKVDGWPWRWECSGCTAGDPARTREQAIDQARGHVATHHRFGFRRSTT